MKPLKQNQLVWGIRILNVSKRKDTAVDPKMLYVILNSTGGHEYLFSVQLLAHENVIIEQVQDNSRPHYLDP